MADHTELALKMTGLAASITNASSYRVVGGEKSLVLPIAEAVTWGKLLVEASQALNSLGDEEANEGIETSNKWLTGELQALVGE